MVYACILRELPSKLGTLTHKIEGLGGVQRIFLFCFNAVDRVRHDAVHVLILEV